jgi:hypothetical protein
LIVSMDTPHGANANEFVGRIVPVLLQNSSALLMHGALIAHPATGHKSNVGTKSANTLVP